jgi:hypothetical protein
MAVEPYPGWQVPSGNRPGRDQPPELAGQRAVAHDAQGPRGQPEYQPGYLTGSRRPDRGAAVR